MKNITTLIFLLMICSCGSSSSKEPFKEGYYLGRGDELKNTAKNENELCSYVTGIQNFNIAISKKDNNTLIFEYLLLSARFGYFTSGLILEAGNNIDEVSYTEENNNSITNVFGGNDLDLSCQRGQIEITLKTQGVNILQNAKSVASCVDNTTASIFNCELEEELVLTPVANDNPST